MRDINQSHSNPDSLRHELAELQERAAKDTLTGLLKRRTINRRLQFMTSEGVCARFIIDRDNFKQINDTLDYRTRDQAIRLPQPDESRLVGFPASRSLLRLAMWEPLSNPMPGSRTQKPGGWCIWAGFQSVMDAY